uniref:Uncharacterized protein n=1 Tax=Rhizophora mucronata TaxID=61149 RepID=A0A2P2N2V0_RHIMU
MMDCKDNHKHTFSGYILLPLHKNKGTKILMKSTIS